MDNRKFDIVSEGVKDLELAVRLVLRQAKGKPTHYYIEGQVTDSDVSVPTLVLLWYGEGNAVPLPFSMREEDVAWFIEGWLRDADYGPQPDHDGSNRKGWRIYCDDWGLVGNFRYGIFGVQPIWAMYGK